MFDGSEKHNHRLGFDWLLKATFRKTWRKEITHQVPVQCHH